MKQNRSGLGGLKSIGKKKSKNKSKSKNRPVNIFDTPRISEGPIGILDSKKSHNNHNSRVNNRKEKTILNFFHIFYVNNFFADSFQSGVSPL